MKEYDAIAIGTGSVMSIIEAMLQSKPNLKIAVIEKDEPGGICLTRGCIPSKILLYPAELVRTIEKASEFGVDVEIKKVSFERVMERMKTIIYKDINMIGYGLTHSTSTDFYNSTAEFVAPYTLKVDNNLITSKLIFLCTGSKPVIPPIRGLQQTGYQTSDTIPKINKLPKSIAIVGGGYIAAEYGHFLSAMGSEVTIIGRNTQFLPAEEPEVSVLLRRELGKHIKILTDHEVLEAYRSSDSEKKLIAINRQNGEKVDISADEVLIAAGRGPNTDILHPEKAGIKIDQEGWIVVNEFLETSSPNVWALGDADGKYMFKHVANYEATVVYYNAILKERVKADYHAVPHAVFTYPEVASVGLKEKEAIERFGSDKILIGIHRYEDTAKGEAMAAKDCFAKVIVERESMRILGAHIIGPYASVLIQEIIDTMYNADGNAFPITRAMHIHPSLAEVVERAFESLMTPEQYHHVLEHYYALSTR